MFSPATVFTKLCLWQVRLQPIIVESYSTGGLVDFKSGYADVEILCAQSYSTFAQMGIIDFSYFKFLRNVLSQCWLSNVWL
jgi:hypothetical protein